MKIKNYLSKILEIPSSLIKRFPFSIIISIISSIIISVFLEKDVLKEVIYLLLFLGIGFLFTEIRFNSKSKKNIGYISSFIMALLFNKYILEGNTLIIKSAIIYGIVLFILGLLKLFKDSKLSLSEYITRVASTAFKVQIIASILSIGIILIAGIIIILFSVSDLLIVRLELLFGGIFVIPALIYTYAETKEKVWDFIKFTINNLLSIILLISFTVVYIYMLKIIITFKIPSNHIFRIISLLFILGLPIWTMVSSFKEDNIIVKINNKLPYIFIPLVFLQIYSIGLRIINNGITLTRYFGICLLFFEIIYIIIYIIKKDKIYIMAYVIIIISIIGIIAPKINAIDLTINNQYNRIISYLKNDNLNVKERKALYDTYIYLTNFKDGRIFINNHLTSKQIEFITKDKYVEYSCYFSSYEKIADIDIDGYKTLTPFAIEELDVNKTYSVFENIIIKNYSIDLVKYFKDFILSSNPDDYILDNNTFEYSNYRIVFTHIDICLEDNIIASYAINGYILEK